MQPEVHILYSSDHYRVINYKCRCMECNRSKTEFNESFSITFITRGNFYYHTHRDQLDSYTGSVLISKPGYEYSITHPASEPDECTILVFTDAFYSLFLEKNPAEASWFFRNKDLQSLLIKLGPQTEYLHYLLLQAVAKASPSRFEIDSMVIELIAQVTAGINESKITDKLSESTKRNHLTTIESAKSYIRENFYRDISLLELASHCYVSPFHFVRLFKSFTHYSPYQYLQLVRLKHAEHLLKTNLPVADVAFSSGFNSIDYFSSAFKKQYKMSPSLFRATRNIAQDF